MVITMKKAKSKKTTKAILMATACALIVALGLGATLAYTTITDKKVNTFTVGEVDIEVDEPNYPGDDDPTVSGMMPDTEVNKDPLIRNTGINDIYAFVSVDSPVENVSVAGGAAAIQEIFWFKQAADASTTHANNWDTAWTKVTSRCGYVKINASGVETPVAAENLATVYAGLGAGEKLYYRYVYAYNTSVAGVSGSTVTSTSSLFDKVQLKTLAAGALDGQTEKIIVNGYGIQANGLILSDGEAPDWSSAADKAEIYDMFF